MKLSQTLAAVLLLGMLAGLPAQASEAMMKKARCNACHAVDRKVVGPAFREVAARYRGDGQVADKLFAKVRAGGSGNWGDIPMMANGPERISDDDLKAVLGWILGLE